MKLNLLKKKFKGKRILITGNTGFVGSWLSLLLSDLGANVLGFSQKKSEEVLKRNIWRTESNRFVNV